MAEPLADRVIKRIGQAEELYHRLVMLVAPAGSGKPAALREVYERTAAPLVNVNLELSRRTKQGTAVLDALELLDLSAVPGQAGGERLDPTGPSTPNTSLTSSRRRATGRWSTAPS